MVHNEYGTQRVLLSSVKRNVLVGRLCLYCILLASFHVLLDSFQGFYKSAIIDALFGLIIFFAYMLSRWKYHKASKIFVLLSLNMLFIFFVSVLPQGIGTYLYYFPLIVASSALFEASEKSLRYFFNALPIGLLILLVMTDFDILKGVEFAAPADVKIFFAVNAFSSAGITIICVN